MHNLKELRKNLDNFKKKLKDRNVDFDTKDFDIKDSLNRDLISKKEKLEQEKKSLSKSKDQSNFEKSKKISKKISDLIEKQSNSQNELDKIIFSLPNLANDDVPIGKDEKSIGRVEIGRNIRREEIEDEVGQRTRRFQREESPYKGHGFPNQVQKEQNNRHYQKALSPTIQCHHHLRDATSNVPPPGFSSKGP